MVIRTEQLLPDETKGSTNKLNRKEYHQKLAPSFKSAPQKSTVQNLQHELPEPTEILHKILRKHLGDLHEEE